MINMDIPDEKESIVLDTDMVCEKHSRMLGEFDIPLTNALSAMNGVCLESDKFSEIAFRIKNGYGPSDISDDGEIPDSEKPGIKHINMTYDSINPACCWIVENVDDPYPDEDAPHLIGVLADHAREAVEDGRW